MESLKKIGAFRIALIVIAGIVLILCSLPLPNNKNDTVVSQKTSVLTDTQEVYEEKVEKQLEEILKEVAGIQSVKVMITWYAGTEKIIEREEVMQEEVQSEAQTDGRVVHVSSKRSENTAVLTEIDGNRVPYVLKELAPVVQGVLIVAEGEITAEKTMQISEAVQALFSIEAHKVKVLEKKMQSEG